MKNKNILITGSTDGIGKQTAKELAVLGYNIIVHGRNEERVKQAVSELQNSNYEVRIEGFTCDFSSLDNVRRFAELVHSKFDRLDVLINNAGVYMKNRQLTEDGFETTFAVNHLAPFLLTYLLLDMLKQSNDGRIVNISSIAHLNAMMEWNNFNGEEYYDAYSAYAFSKFANILFTKELSRRLTNNSTTTNALHPGVISTKLLKSGFNITGDSLKKGAATSVYLASSKEVKNISGEYFNDCILSRSHPLTYDKDVCQKFWTLSEEMVGL